MKVIRISRAGFPGWGAFHYLNYFVWVLSKKYMVIVDSKNPDIVLCNTYYTPPNDWDYQTNDYVKTHADYPNAKKVIITSENRGGYNSILGEGENYYCIGHEKVDDPRYLQMSTCVLDCWVLFDESRMFDTPFRWLTDKRDVERMFNEKQHFCSVVQASTKKEREIMFDVLEKYKPVRSPGPWRGNLADHEFPNKHQYSRRDYYGRVDGIVYRDKINFFKEHKFNIAFQYGEEMIHEKIFHAYAGETIPIFHGHSTMRNENFNPDAYINTHEFESFEHAAEEAFRIDQDDQRYKKMLSEPLFIDNKLPEYFEPEYLLSFLERILEK